MDVTDIVIHGPAGVGGAKHPVVVVVSPVPAKEPEDGEHCGYLRRRKKRRDG